MECSNIVIMKDIFKKHGQDKDIIGLTIIIDGTIQKAFDIIQNERAYDSYEEVLRDIIIEGINSIVKKC